MAKKNECYLCGGKLRGGYCPDCGLDNTRIRKKHYHLNESYAVESINGDAGRAPEKCDFKAEQVIQNEKRFDGEAKEKRETRKKDGSRQKESRTKKKYSYQFRNPKLRKPGRDPFHKTPVAWKSKMILTAAVLAVVVIRIGGKYVYEHGLSFGVEEKTENVSVGPYEYVERELAETGNHYETELGQGEYLAGVHLPEGSYTVELLEGRGGLSLEDMENGIYIWQSFGTEAEYEELQVLEDVRLYDGAHVTVRDAVRLSLTTENGQTEDMKCVENPLTESVSIQKDETLAVGDDIVSGVYDFHTESEWTNLRCRIPDDAYEEGYYEVSYWLSGEELDDTYRNIYLRENTLVTAEEGALELIPSSVIGTGDYGEYYRYY